MGLEFKSFHFYAYCLDFRNKKVKEHNQEFFLDSFISRRSIKYLKGVAKEAV